LASTEHERAEREEKRIIKEQKITGSSFDFSLEQILAQFLSGFRTLALGLFKIRLVFGWSTIWLFFVILMESLWSRDLNYEMNFFWVILSRKTAENNNLTKNQIRVKKLSTHPKLMPS
jgi:hypothetical protein